MKSGVWTAPVTGVYMVSQSESREVNTSLRPKSVYNRASKAWDDALSKARGDGISYPKAARLAMEAYEEVLFEYDKRHGIQT